MTKDNKGLRKGEIIIHAPLPRNIKILCPKCKSERIIGIQNKIKKCLDCYSSFKIPEVIKT